MVQKTASIIILVIITSSTISGQVTTYKLVNSLKPNKTILLKNYPDGFLQVNLKPKVDSTSKTITDKQVYGHIDSMSLRELFFNVENLYIQKGEEMGHCSNSSSQTFHCDENFIQTYPFSEIEQITYSSSFQSNAVFPTAMTMFASGLTALVVAPLVSINYSTGEFDTGRYYKVAGAGLAGFAITLPLVIKFQGKKYSITNKDTPKKGYWYFSE